MRRHFENNLFPKVVRYIYSNYLIAKDNLLSLIITLLASIGVLNDDNDDVNYYM